MNSDAIRVGPSRSYDLGRIPGDHLDAFGNVEGPVIGTALEKMLDGPTLQGKVIGTYLVEAALLSTSVGSYDRETTRA